MKRSRQRWGDGIAAPALLASAVVLVLLTLGDGVDAGLVFSSQFGEYLLGRLMALPKAVSAGVQGLQTHRAGEGLCCDALLI
ncbi:MAG: hypothetical protein ABI400_03175, partial [Lacisediminihabitans sp.]